jgi:ComF family protein
MGGVRGLISGIADLLYPRRCAGCGSAVVGCGVAFCWDCMAGCEFVRDPFCSRCGDPVLGVVGHAFVCGWCKRAEPGFTVARSAARFRGPVREALHALKYGGVTALSRDLSVLLESCVRCHYGDLSFDAVCCIPLHGSRLRSRTYNQAALLSVALARRLGVVSRPAALLRLRPTPTQTRLTARERSLNVRGAFAVRDEAWVAGRRLLLVDDVMTTGATVSEASRAMRAAGAASVHVVSVARG